MAFANSIAPAYTPHTHSAKINVNYNTRYVVTVRHIKGGTFALMTDTESHLSFSFIAVLDSCSHGVPTE